MRGFMDAAWSIPKCYGDKAGHIAFIGRRVTPVPTSFPEELVLTP
jgi:hypothetical protein